MCQLEIGASYEGLKHYSRNIPNLDVTSFTNQALKSHAGHGQQNKRLLNCCYFCVPISSVGIATDYGLDGSGIESR